MGSRYTPHLSLSLHHSDISRWNAFVPAWFATTPVPLPLLVVAYVGLLYLVLRGRNSCIELRPLIPRYSVACRRKHTIPRLWHIWITVRLQTRMSAYTWQTPQADGRTAQRLHRVRFPNRRLPPQSTFVSINRRLMKTGLLNVNRYDCGWDSARTEVREAMVADTTHNQDAPSSALAFGRSCTSSSCTRNVWTV